MNATTIRSDIRTSSWLMISACAVTLVAIFGMGAATGAGNYFDENPAVKEQAIADYRLEIWILLLGVGIGLIIFGVALFLLGRALSILCSGWRAKAAGWAKWFALVVTVVGASPYFLGPHSRVDEPGLNFDFVAGITTLGGTSLVVIIFGILMILGPTPTWTGIVMIVGAVLAVPAFLPLFWFAAGLISGLGLLRWSRRVDVRPAEQIQPASPR